MAIYIKDLMIQSFRGIRNLNVKNFNHVNIIVGDNNCGKTSVLEAMLLLRNPGSMVNIVRMSRLREANIYRATTSYEDFMNLFSKDVKEIKIDVSAQMDGGWFAGCNLEGEEKQVFLDGYEIQGLSRAGSWKNPPTVTEEVTAFEGWLQSQYAGVIDSKELFVHKYTRFTGMEVGRGDLVKMNYLAPFDHVSKNVLSKILWNEDYKRLCVHILQIFDPGIEDILILKNEVTGRSVEYISHRHRGKMPVSTYGDGIKKVLSLANAIAQSADGILLIDEVETAIHSKYYYDIFSFLVLACKQFNVQLFVTTHSIEAVDGLLETQNYDRQDSRDDITVITLKKDIEKTYCRTLSGRRVAENRDSFGFEVRL